LQVTSKAAGKKRVAAAARAAPAYLRGR